MSDIDVQTDAGHHTIYIKRLEKRNALNIQMYIALTQAFEQAEQNPSVHSLILTGDATCFMAGNDLNDFLTADFDSLVKNPIYQFLKTCAQLTKPLILGVCGPAIGIGATILLHSDIVFMGEETQIQMPFSQLGLVPEFASSLLLPERIGFARASEMLLLGKKINAQQALDWGLANEIFANEQVETHCQSLAQQFATLPLDSLMITKKLLRGYRWPAIEKQMTQEIDYFAQQLRKPQTQSLIHSKIGRPK